MTSTQYNDLSTTIHSKALVIGRTALEKKATDVVILKVESLTPVADFFIFCSGNSERQVRAIADAIDSEVSRLYSSNATIEGETSATWILMDYGDIVVHIFQEEIRSYYGIENMWRDAEQIPVSEFEPSLPSSLPRPTQPLCMKVVHH